MIQDETHVDWFETQLEAIRLVGLDNYLSQQIVKDGEYATKPAAGAAPRGPPRRAFFLASAHAS